MTHRVYLVSVARVLDILEQKSM